MKIAIVAWGSIIWDPKTLKFLSAFVPTELRLPIEFCRISRDGRLTLVVDEEFGKLCRTFVATSRFDELHQVIEDLRAREETNKEKIGFVDCLSGENNARGQVGRPGISETIRLWAVANGYDAAVWTALSGNFSKPDRANESFTVNAAIRYLETLDNEKLERALNYVRRAPQEVQTPLRTAVNARWSQSGQI